MNEEGLFEFNDALRISDDIWCYGFNKTNGTRYGIMGYGKR